MRNVLFPLPLALLLSFFNAPHACARTALIDQPVEQKLSAENLRPAPACSDSDFIRRVSLDLTGQLPAPAVTRAFLADPSPDKRSRLIDTLLACEDFVSYSALHWSDVLRIKSEYPVRVWPKGVAAYNLWLRDALRQNLPYDQFVRQLLTASGSNFRDGPANFFRAHPTKDPVSFAEATAATFLGTRLSCIRCHDQPGQSYTRADLHGLAACFAPVAFKATAEWKEEIVYLNLTATFTAPGEKSPTAPRPLGGPAFVLAPGDDPRRPLADWLTLPANSLFAEVAVNRVWFWLLGRGLVHEPDDFRPSNPPSHPALLRALAAEFSKNGYDLRALHRLILNSDTYQRSAHFPSSQKTPPALYATHTCRRLTAEQLLDAISHVTGTSETFQSQIPEPFTKRPENFHAADLEDGNVECSFLELFGRPARDTYYASERDDSPTQRQALYLINAEELAAKINRSPRLVVLLSQHRQPRPLIDELFFLTLCRPPSADELATVLTLFNARPEARAENTRDLLWALINTKEFLFTH